jgi:hypothetical protein
VTILEHSKSTQRQTAGDQSQQIMVMGDYHAGLSRPEVIDVLREQAPHVLAEFSAVAVAEVMQRIEGGMIALATRLDQRNLLDAAANPDFQLAFRKGLLEIAKSDDPNKTDRIVEILAEKAKVPKNDRVRLHTEKALEIASYVGSEAMSGLVVCGLSGWISPHSSDPTEAVEAFSGCVLPFALNLPNQHGWIEDLEIGRVLSRSGPLTQRNPFLELFSMTASHLVTQGFNLGVQLNEQVVEKLVALRAIKESPVGDGRFVSAICKTMILESKNAEIITTATGMSVGEYVQAIGFETPSPDRKEILRAVLAESAFQNVIDWYNSLPPFELTAVGRVLVFCEVQRLEPTTAALFPSLETLL